MNMKDMELQPHAMIDIEKILADWAAEWNETPETCTEEWELTAFPVLTEGLLALQFEHSVDRYWAEGEDLYSQNVERQYRILVYDCATGEKTGQYRFRVEFGHSATVFFHEGALYAAIAADGETDYTAVRMWPAAEADEEPIELGGYINCMAVRSNGEIIVSCTRDPGEEIPEGPALQIFRPGMPPQALNLEDGFYVRDIYLDTDENLWLTCSDEKTVVAMIGSKLLAHTLPIPDVLSVAVPTDRSRMYVVQNLPFGPELVCIPMERIGDDAEPRYCRIETVDGTQAVLTSASFLKNYAVLQFEQKLYIVDLDRQ